MLFCELFSYPFFFSRAHCIIMEDALQDLLKAHRVPEICYNFLRAQSPPIFTTSQLAALADDVEELKAAFIEPSAEHGEVPEGQMLGYTACVRAAWKEAHAAAHSQLEEKNEPEKEEINPVSGDEKKKMMEKFEARFGFQMPLETQPSNKLLGQLKKMRRRKICEFLPLQKCTSAADQLTTEEKKHDMGPFSVMLREDTKKTRFHQYAPPFFRGVKDFL